jgi:hypothetical protein
MAVQQKPVEVLSLMKPRCTVETELSTATGGTPFGSHRTTGGASKNRDRKQT